jgi:erythromycin esterase-like protein
MLMAMRAAPPGRGFYLSPPAEIRRRRSVPWEGRARAPARPPPARSADDGLEPLKGIIGKASVVGLGESIHTSGGFYRMKHRVFRFLVEKMGFRAFAIESPWIAADQVAAT